MARSEEYEIALMMRFGNLYNMPPKRAKFVLYRSYVLFLIFYILFDTFYIFCILVRIFYYILYCFILYSIYSGPNLIKIQYFTVFLYMYI